MTMTDAEVTEQISRADAFRESLRAAVDEARADLDPHSACIDQARAGLARIAATLDQADNILIANLSNIDAAMKKHGTGLMPVIEMHLRAVGCGPELDYESAVALLAVFQPVIDAVLKRKVN